MCTVIERKHKGHPKTAEQDIEVYKVCDVWENKIFSSYENFPYEIGKLYSSKFTFDSDTSISDYIEGEYVDTLTDPCYIVTGLHSFKTNDEKRMNLHKFSRSVYCKFIIPKGGRYYENGCGNIVSNQIIFKEILS